MRTLIVTEFVITEYKNRAYVSSEFSSILQRYFDSFGKLDIISRVRIKENSPELIDITEMVNSITGIKLIDAFTFKCMKQLRPLVKNSDLVIGRFDSIVACRAASVSHKFKVPFLAEVMADAWDGYWNHGIIGKIIAPYMFFSTKASLKKANYAVYVTREHLQKRYPCKCPNINASNVKVSKPNSEVLIERNNRIQNMDTKNISILTTAAVSVRAKGQEYAIQAVSILKKQGVNINYYLIGGGDSSYLKSVAKKYNVQENIHFLGRLPLNKVFEKIRDIDIYVQPSLQEGLPRSVIEAMSYGCPAIGARTAGIPELLSPECVFKRKSAQAISETILRINNKNHLERLSKRNAKEAEKYYEDVLNSNRNAFYDKIIRSIQTP